MGTTLTPPEIETTDGEQRLVLSGVLWEQYVAIADALPDRPNLRMIYIDGSLTFLILSRRHDRYEDQLDNLIKAVARAFDIVYDVSGSATLRREGVGVGVEPDRAYYFGDHAFLMCGFIEIDLDSQPPPDLIIEVEVSHPADRAMAIHSRLGVPEVWRYDVRKNTLGFYSLSEVGAYISIGRSRYLPMLGPADVLAQLELGKSVVPFSRWLDQLSDWVRDELAPRLDRGGPRP